LILIHLYCARQAYRKVAIECFKKKWEASKKDGRTERDGRTEKDSSTLEKAWEAMKKEQVCHL
jgi:hypothetical protein